LKLLHTNPQELRQLHEQARASTREARGAEEVAGQSMSVCSKEVSVEPSSDPGENVDSDDAARQEQPAWWTARVRKQERDGRMLASQASRPPTTASDQVDRASRTGSGSLPTSRTEDIGTSPIALARKQQREESCANYERGRR
jgi:hypothetical protein